MRYFLSFLALVFSYTSYGQLTLTDQSNCLSYTITATMVGLTPTSSGITLDDGWGPVTNIGFTFKFFATNYTQLIIGSNGEIGFDIANANAYNTWPIGNTLAATAATGGGDMHNLIAAPWCDIYIPAGGNLMYSLVGTAPNRKFEVTWCGEAMYSCNAQFTTSQAIIYETTNIVEVHIGHKTVCAGWNGGYAETGVVNQNGSSCTMAPGPPILEDYPNQWSVTTTPQAWRFTPNAAGTSYTVASIPYAPIPYASSTIYWYDSATHAYLGSGVNIVVTPAVTTTYEAAALGCGDTTKAFITLGPVGTGGTTGGVPHIRAITSTNALACGACNGTTKLYGITPGQIDTVFTTINGIPQPPFVITTPPDSTWTFTGLCTGTYAYYVKVGNCPSNTVTATITAPVLAVSSDNETNPTICGQCDGTITLHGLWPDSLAHISYTFGGTTHAYTGTVMPDSSITLINLCAGPYTNITATIGLCTAPANPLTLVDPAPFPPTFTYTTRLHCTGDEIDLTNTTIPAGYSSTWSYSDGTASDNTTDATHIFRDDQLTPQYTGTVTVTLTYEENNNPACVASTSQVIPFNHPIDAHITPQSTAVCLNVPTTFTGTTISGNLPSYTWDFGNGTSSATSFSNTIDYPYPYAGNFTIRLTVADSIGCIATDSAQVQVVQIIVQTGTHDTSICLSDSMLMSALVIVTPDTVSYTIAWTPTNNIGNNNTATTNFSGLGDYVYTATATTNVLGCVASDTEAVHSFPPITLTNLTASQNIPWGSTIQLNADGAVYYTWAPNDGSLSNPNINNPVAAPIDSVTKYTVYGMSLYGCLDSASLTITMGSMTQIVPSAFTPNGDGLNDVFRVTNMTFQKLVDFRVYNRWGQMVFQTANRETGWDGTFNGVPQDIGVYSYQVIVGLVDGTNKTYSGTVTLIR